MAVRPAFVRLALRARIDRHRDAAGRVEQVRQQRAAQIRADLQIGVAGLECSDETLDAEKRRAIRVVAGLNGETEVSSASILDTAVWRAFWPSVKPVRSDDAMSRN